MIDELMSLNESAVDDEEMCLQQQLSMAAAASTAHGGIAGA